MCVDMRTDMRGAHAMHRWKPLVEAVIMSTGHIRYPSARHRRAMPMTVQRPVVVVIVGSVAARCHRPNLRQLGGPPKPMQVRGCIWRLAATCLALPAMPHLRFFSYIGACRRRNTGEPLRRVRWRSAVCLIGRAFPMAGASKPSQPSALAVSVLGV